MFIASIPLKVFLALLNASFDFDIGFVNPPQIIGGASNEVESVYLILGHTSAPIG
jgi:hypothetical protein